MREYLDMVRPFMLREKTEQSPVCNTNGNSSHDRGSGKSSKYYTSKAISRRISPDTLRHSFAALWCKEQKPERCQLMLGHSDISSTQVYLQIATAIHKNDIEDL